MLAVGVLVLVCGCMTGYTTSALFLSSSSVHRVSGTEINQSLRGYKCFVRRAEEWNIDVQ
ncbi:Uncharacterized protein APZ42_006964 [Daphnia magna]|uniref:Uncharacterized protein n=1 Tax=Daphnia magna TaxID=35525 RepID=A0A164FLG1_9CRUS|nr:Uncharacterized protein APZ42_006964 [Daphnia magna]